MAETIINDYPPMSPEELYWLDELRDREFTGPTPEEVLEWDEVDVLFMDFLENNRATELAEDLNSAEEAVRRYRYIWKQVGFNRPRGIEGSSLRATAIKSNQLDRGVAETKVSQERELELHSMTPQSLYEINRSKTELGDGVSAGLVGLMREADWPASVFDILQVYATTLASEPEQLGTISDNHEGKQ